jgi:inner membrane protein
MFGLALGPALVPRRLLLAGMAAAILPDLDVIGFRLGISYGQDLGHRGVSHSLVFALLLGLMAAAAAGSLRSGRKSAFAFVAMGAASHGLLDMCTNGGLGVALLWPWSAERLFFPAHPIQVSPFSLSKVFGPDAMRLFGSELLWVWLPCMLGGLAVYCVRRALRRKRAGPTGKEVPSNTFERKAAP